MPIVLACVLPQTEPYIKTYSLVAYLAGDRREEERGSGKSRAGKADVRVTIEAAAVANGVLILPGS